MPYIFSVFKFLTQDTIIIRPSTHKLFDIDYIKNKEKILKTLKALDIDIIDFISEENDIKNIKTKLSDNDYNNITIAAFNKYYRQEALKKLLEYDCLDDLLKLITKYER